MGCLDSTIYQHASEQVYYQFKNVLQLRNTFIDKIISIEKPLEVKQLKNAGVCSVLEETLCVLLKKKKKKKKKKELLK